MGVKKSKREPELTGSVRSICKLFIRILITSQANKRLIKLKGNEKSKDGAFLFCPGLTFDNCVKSSV